MVWKQLGELPLSLCPQETVKCGRKLRLQPKEKWVPSQVPLLSG